MPENRNVFELDAYLVHDSLVGTVHFPGSHYITAMSDGMGAHILLAHPSMRAHGSFTSPLVSRSHRRFFATPLASPRTLVTWELGGEANPFIAKMSIAGPTHVGGQRAKTNLEMEGLISIYKSHAIKEALIRTSPRSVQNFFFEEAYMALNVPQQPNFGMLFRAIPAEILRGECLFIPFLSLPFTQIRPGQRPLLAHCLHISRLNVRRFLMEKIYLPVINFILDCSRQGIYACSLHGQNLLIGLDIDLTNPMEAQIEGFSGRVLYRDIADLKIAEEKLSDTLKELRRRSGGAPNTTTRGCYIYMASVNFIKKSLYPIIYALKHWQSAGLITESHVIDQDVLMTDFFSTLRHILHTELTRQLTERLVREYEDTYISIAEIRDFAQAEIRLSGDTKRRREWLIKAATEFNAECSLARPHCSALTAEEVRLRDENKNASLRHYIEELTKQYIDLDMMEAAESGYGASGMGSSVMPPWSGAIPATTSTTPLWVDASVARTGSTMPWGSSGVTRVGSATAQSSIPETESVAPRRSLTRTERPMSRATSAGPAFGMRASCSGVPSVFSTQFISYCPRATPVVFR